MFEIVPATTETHYRLVRELLTQQVAWDTAETARPGLNAQECLDIYFASGETVLPGRSSLQAASRGATREPQIRCRWPRGGI
jgi:hypothetical protein